MNPTEHESAYDILVERLWSDLSKVTSRDSARRFARDGAKLVRRQANQVPEFYVEEFLDIFKDVLVRRMRQETEAVTKGLDEAKMEADVASVELTARVDAAKAAGDREAQHAAWKERDERQRAIQARVDSFHADIKSLEPRQDAFTRLASALDVNFT